MAEMPCAERNVRRIVLTSALQIKTAVDSALLGHMLQQPLAQRLREAVNPAEATASSSAATEEEERYRRIEEFCAVLRTEASSDFKLPQFSGISRDAPKRVSFADEPPLGAPIFKLDRGINLFYDAVVRLGNATQSDSDSDDAVAGAAAPQSDARKLAETLLQAVKHAPTDRLGCIRADCLTTDRVDQLGMSAPNFARPLLDIPQIVLWCQCQRLAFIFKRAIKVHV